MIQPAKIGSWSATALMSAAVATQPASLSALDMSIRSVKRAITPVRDGSDLVMLAALRQMHDPSLKPLFERLALDASNPQAQVHSLLALAELDGEAGHVSTTLIRQLQSPEGRLQAVAAALADDRLTPDQCAELVSAPEPEPLTKLWLMATLTEDGRDVDTALLNSLAASPNIDVAGFASLLLLRLGDAAPFEAYEQRLAEFTRTAARPTIQLHIAGMFDVISQYKITQAETWVAAKLDESQSEEVEDAALGALFAIDPSPAASHWSQAVQSATSPARLLRLALIALDSEAELSAATFDPLINSEVDLIRRLGAVGRAAAGTASDGEEMNTAGGGDVTAALIELIALDHPRASAWALKFASDLAAEQAADVYRAAIERGASARDISDVRLTTAADATARLYKSDAHAAIALLDSAPDDSHLQEAILLGMTVTGDARAAQAAANVDRSGASRADAIALILLARFTEALSPDDLAKLGVIAAGGTHLSDTLRTQAAWLFIRHNAKVADAMTSIFETSTTETAHERR